MIYVDRRAVLHGDVKILVKNGKWLPVPEIVEYKDTERPKRNDTKG